MINTIIFDLGGVLVKWDPKNLYRKMFSDAEEMDYFLNHVCTMDWNEQQDAGRSWQEANEILLPQFPNYQKEIMAYSELWEEMLGGAIDGTVDFLRLAKTYSLANQTWNGTAIMAIMSRYEVISA